MRPSSLRPILRCMTTSRVEEVPLGPSRSGGTGPPRSSLACASARTASLAGETGPRTALAAASPRTASLAGEVQTPLHSPRHRLPPSPAALLELSPLLMALHPSPAALLELSPLLMALPPSP